MKNFKSIIAILAAIALFVGATSFIAFAEPTAPTGAHVVGAANSEQLKDFTITQLKLAKDRNGNDYCRFIANEQREISGTTYSVGVPVMTFSSTAPDAYNKLSKMANGQRVKLIVQQQSYQGRPNYTVLAVAGPAIAKK